MKEKGGVAPAFHRFSACRSTGQVPQHISEFAPYDEILVQCRSGARSADIVRFLRDDIGMKNVKNVKGGILAWAREIDPSLPQY